jgi:hypothetical protein
MLGEQLESNRFRRWIEAQRVALLREYLCREQQGCDREHADNGHAKDAATLPLKRFNRNPASSHRDYAFA